MPSLVQFSVGTFNKGLLPDPVQPLVPNPALIPQSTGIEQFDRKILTLSSFTKGTLP